MTDEIIKALGKRQVLRNHTPVCPNVSCIYSWEVDLFSVNKSGFCYEFEVKISRQDFLKDKRKRKWSMMEWKKKVDTPNYMSYVCPKDLIKENEIPDFAGLYYYVDGEIEQVKAPVLIHDAKKDLAVINMKLARLYSQRHFLGCSMLTHLNNEIRQRNDERKKQEEENRKRMMERLLQFNKEQSVQVSDTTKSNQGTEPQ